MAENQENFEVDLDALDESIATEEIVINTETNPLDEPSPVSDGTHRVKLLQAPQGAWSKKDWTGKDGVVHDFLSVKFSLSVVDEGVDFNKRIFPQAINTIVFDGKCEMAYILIQIYGGDESAKARVKALTNYIALGKAFKDALAGEPIISATTKWVAQYKTGQKDKKGRDIYRTALSGMKNFKKRPDGTYDPQVVVNGNEAIARATVIAYGPDAV